MGTFWAAASMVVTLVTAVVGAWITFTVGFPWRRLSYWELAAAPLLAEDALLIAPVGLRGDLEFRHCGIPPTSWSASCPTCQHCQPGWGALCDL